MSYIGETRAFRKEADKLQEKLKREKDPAERIKLREQIKWYEDEARAAWSMARTECCVE